MTIGEAVEIIALDVRMAARRSAQPITLLLVEERVSELRPSDSMKGTAATLLACNGARLRRALRVAQQQEAAR